MACGGATASMALPSEAKNSICALTKTSPIISRGASRRICRLIGHGSCRQTAASYLRPGLVVVLPADVANGAPFRCNGRSTKSRQKIGRRSAIVAFV